MSVPANKDLGLLTQDDLQDIFDIIHTANCNLRLSEMRARVVVSLRHAFQAEGVAFFLADEKYKGINNGSIVGSGINLRYLDRWASH